MILSPTDDALEPDRMRASVRLLDTGEAQHVGDQAEAASEALAGGDVLVISSTTIIIGLLILLVILIAD